MSQKKYGVDLTAAEWEELLALGKKGATVARCLTRASILLLAAEGKTDREIAHTLHVERT